MEGKRCHFFCRMVHVLRVIATGILSPLYLSNINVKSIRSCVPNIFHAPVLPPGGFCRTRRRAPLGCGRRFTAAPLLGMASLQGSAMAQQGPSICREKTCKVRQRWFLVTLLLCQQILRNRKYKGCFPQCRWHPTLKWHSCFVTSLALKCDRNKLKRTAILQNTLKLT